MIKVEITDGNTTFLLSPHSIEIPDVRNMNESLQHEEQTCEMTAVFDVDLLSLLMNHADLQACVSDGETSLFTGFVDNNTDLTDNGEPEPADIINITIRDRTRLFDITTESEVAQIGKTLSQIVSVICQNCNVTNAAVFSDNPQVAAFVLDKDKKYLDALNTLLFQYGYTWFFNEDGEFEVLKINLQNVTESITDSDLFTGLNISKTRKNYNAVKVTYGTLTKKGNEQVFFTGNGLGGDNKVVPFTIRPGQYYPYESDPAQEQREGKVFQNFESGYAEEYQTYSGEKKFRRATNQTLIYTENHKVVEDWEGSIVINRTEYGARSAAVRLLNTGTEDAELKQFAIRADAYYRSSNNSVTVGSGKKEYSYEAEHIYDDTAASNLATLLCKLYTDTCIKFSGKIRRNIKPGTICSIDTGLSGITCNALVINSQYDPENDLHTITLNSISEVQMNSSRYKERKSENSLTENLALLDEAISDLKDGTADVGNPDSVEGLTAVAKRDSISISWSSARDNGLSNSIKYYILKISKDNGVSWSDPIYLTDYSYEYVFTRTGQGSDGYPEASAFANWKVKVVAVNIYGKNSTPTVQPVDASSYGTWIPVVPSLSKIPEENGINFEWPAPIGANSRTLYGSNQYELTVTYNGTNRPVITTSELNAVYTFDRDSQVDGYPETIHDEEHTGLDLFSFKLKVINESGNFRQSNAQSFSSAETENYGTWIPVASSFIKRAAAEYGIDYEWTRAAADGNIQLYGSNTYKLRVHCGDTLRTTIEKGTLSAIYNFDRATDGYPEKHGVTGAAHTLDEYTATIEVINVSGNSATSQTATTTDSTYLGWKPAIPTITTRSSGRALTINPVNSEQRYGKIRYHYLINNLKKDGNNYYLPTPTADYLASEDNYKDGTCPDIPFVADSPYTQTMPLKGQNATSYKLCSWEGAATQDEYDEAEKKSIVYSSTDPSTGHSATTRTMNINEISETVKYWYDSTEQVHYASFETPMPAAIDTEYRFKIQAFNSVADNIASAYSEPVSVTAKATAAYDVVNGAITANALAPDAVTTEKIAAGSITAEKIFVRALAAISANLGRITDGSLVGNENNYWYLSAPTEQGNTHHAGDFRVGGASGSDYIKCTTQDGTTYNIEIHASKFELTAVGTLIHGEFYVCDAEQALDSDGRPTDYYAKITSSAIEMKKPVTISNNLNVGGSFSITDATNRNNATNELINSLTEGSSAPQDDDYYVAQYAGGGTTTKTYLRRKHSSLWNYIKDKISSVLGLTASAYGGNSATATSATSSTRLSSIAIANIRIGSAQAKISLNQLMTWLITTKAYIPIGVDCYKVLGVPWDYAGNDILQLAINGQNYELQLAGCLIEFMGTATGYQTGRFRLIIHSSPTTSFSATSGYLKFPVSTAAEYTCNGSGYSPTWKFVNPSVGYGIGDSVKILTAAATAAKTCEVSGLRLIKGAEFIVYLNTTNSVENATLNVNGTGAKTIKINGSAVTTSNFTAGYYKAYYDGSNWQLTTYQNYNSYLSHMSDYSTLAYSCGIEFGWCTGFHTLEGNQIDISLPNIKSLSYSESVHNARILFFNSDDRPVNSYWDADLTLYISGSSMGVKPVRVAQANGTKTSIRRLPAGFYAATYFDSDGYWTLTPITTFSGKDYKENLTFASLGALCIKACQLTTASGYIVFTNGLKIEWGYATSSQNADMTVTYNVVFTQAPIVTLAAGNTANSRERWNYPVNIYGVSNTTFKICSNSSLNGAKVFYIAIGY